MRFTPGVLTCSDHYPNTKRLSRFRYIRVDLLPATNLENQMPLENSIFNLQALKASLVLFNLISA